MPMPCPGGRCWLAPAILVVIPMCASAAAVSPFDPGWASATHLTSPKTIYVYTWPQSVQAGDTLSIYVSSISPTVKIRFQRIAANDTYVVDASGQDHPGVPAGVQTVDAGGSATHGVWADGCGWQPTFRAVIPASWPSGPYYVAVSPENGESALNTQFATFTVRSRTNVSPVAVVLGSSTWYAYLGWGGRSLYDSPYWDRTFISSMRRPAERNSGRGNFYTRDFPWVRFFAHNDITPDYLTMEDIQRFGHSILDGHREVVFVGHSEYWSNEQRDAVEWYIAHGGNVFFACGNICWWRVEYSADLSQMICYRGDNVCDADGGTRGIPPGQQYLATAYQAFPPHPSTYMWREAPANRGAYSMTGVDFFDAQIAATDIDGHGTPSDWSIRTPGSWVFAGTSAALGTRLHTRYLPGDEVDGVLLDWAGPADAPGSTPVVRTDAFARGTPASFRVLATAEAAQFSHLYAVTPRWAVMGTYQRPGEGMVVTWPEQLLGYEVWDPADDGEQCVLAAQIARNIVLGLSGANGATSVPAGADQIEAEVRPNPSSAALGDDVELSLRVTHAQRYALDLFSTTGARVARQEGSVEAGPSTVAWRFPRALPAGMYLWRLATAEGSASGKIVRVR